MSESSRQTMSAAPGQSSSGWPDGWYVYVDGQVEGPFSAEHTFGMRAETAEGKPRLVSRSGFSQWYALKDLAEIFRLTEKLGQKADREQKASEEQMVAALNGLAAMAKTADVKAVEAVGAHHVAKAAQAATGRPEVKKGVVGVSAAPAKVAGPAVADVKGAVQPATAVSPVADGVQAAGRKAGKKADKSGKHQKTEAAAATVAKPVSKPVSAKKREAQEYYFLKGRLKLGSLHNPWWTGFVLLPLTLGLLWLKWFTETVREVDAHHGQTGGAPAGKMPPSWLAFVPGLHIYMTWRLARQVLAMEQQNCYRSISPGVAAMFAIIPPFAVAYLQDALNRHWLLHVRHAMFERTCTDSTEVAS